MTGLIAQRTDIAAIFAISAIAMPIAVMANCDLRV